MKQVKIFTRLTSNENKWEIPSPHKWRKVDQGKNNVPFENQYGFGHEEWLFHPRYNVNGYQYGYIKGVSNGKQVIDSYNEIHLYTVKKEKNVNLVYYLGYIKDAICIKSENNQSAQELAIKWKEDMLNEIEDINGDIKGLTKFPFMPVVKFKMANVIFFEEPIFQPNFPLGTYKRFQPYEFSGSTESIFETRILSGSGFAPGRAKQKDVYNRKNKESSVTIVKLHSEIVQALEILLKPEYSITKGNISIETTRFNGNIADVVTLDSNCGITIYEIKTSLSGRRNLREAISQLLDYALHSSEKVNSLFIVSPAALTPDEFLFLKKLNKSINFKIEYLHYDKKQASKFSCGKI